MYVFYIFVSLFRRLLPSSVSQFKLLIFFFNLKLYKMFTKNFSIELLRRKKSNHLFWPKLKQTFFFKLTLIYTMIFQSSHSKHAGFSFLSHMFSNKKIMQKYNNRCDLKLYIVSKFI